MPPPPRPLRSPGPARPEASGPARLPRLPDSPGPLDGLPLQPGEGLLGAGGSLEPGLVWHAYRHGAFPWFSEGDPVLWWSPDPRAVLWPQGLRVSRRLARTLRSGRFEVRRDTAFDAVVAGCAARESTWITEGMARCYGTLHAQGRAHSFEVLHEGQLCGGLYGVRVGPVFCAESMFHTESDASKVALVEAVRRLAAEGVTCIDVQFLTPHLVRMGACEIPRREYLGLLPRTLP